MMLVRERYGTREQFLAAMNPTVQKYAARNPERCFLGHAPSLGVVNQAYGRNTATMWLIAQLVDLVAFTNSKQLLNEQQVAMVAEMIAQEYGNLKCSELMLFFYRFKLGRYGHFYGSVDPMLITTALHKFLDERSEALRKHEIEQQQQQREQWAREAITPQEYCKRHNLPPMDSVVEIMNYINNQSNHDNEKEN